MSAELLIQPPCARWLELIQRPPAGELLGRPLRWWRQESRRELGLATDRPIVASGHQTLLWHPGILAKYFAAEAFARNHMLAAANLVVDQHAERFGEFEIPIRRDEGSLDVRTIELCRPRPPKDMPMGVHGAFTPPPRPERLNAAQSSVAEGVQKIFEAVYAHRNAANAALQMAAAIADLMSPWVGRMPDVTSTDLIRTSLGRAMLQAMADEPHRCAECYNRAVAAVPEAGIGPLLIREDYVELPLWRIREDGRRMHAYDSDIAANLDHNKSKIQNPKSKIPLMPRALFMTALVRLCMCDLFIHGTGGANYDRAMELWIQDWLGVRPSAIAVVSATLRLPLLAADGADSDVHAATVRLRKLWHDPHTSDGLSDIKRQHVSEIERLPRNSSQRKIAFLKMHEQLGRMRQSRADEVSRAQDSLRNARLRAADLAIASRRDWPFPLYPKMMLDEMFQQMTAALGCTGVKSADFTDSAD